ncbi:MAG TPA: hypothetical protein VFN88_03915 [Caulobacteraceae bacterium]|nr:hypothetical protein [Caulobacteraceae bacterium]
MLRGILIAISVVMLAAAAVLALSGRFEPGLITLIAWGVILFVGVVFERRMYKQVLDAPPGGDFQPTSERFRDPQSGQETVVYYNAKTGKRAYVRA